jgi:hypothetical protein
MGYDTLVRSAVALASRVTTSLQATVTHTPATAALDSEGRAVPGTPVQRPAIVEYRQALVKQPDGTLIKSRATVTFLGPVALTLLDTLVLPDGSTGALLAIGGEVDPTTGAPYAPTVWLGA